MRFGFLVGLGLLLGAGAGIGAAIWLGADDDSSAATTTSVVETSAEGPLLDTSVAAQRELAEEFLRDWVRFRNADAVVTSSIERERPDDGSTLEDVQVLVQNDTGRLIRSFAGIEGYRGNTAVFCTSATGDAEDTDDLECRDLDGAPTRTEALANEMTVLSGLVIGDPPRYRLIRQESDCWELILTTNTIDAPYGDRSTFCFDESTGTLASKVTEYSNGLVETIEAQSVRTVVTNEDFAALLGA